jgi:ferrous iron transport protein A
MSSHQATPVEDLPPMLSLSQLRAGQCARIEAVEGDDPLVQRLMEMGLLEGEDIEVVGFAPLGDPMEIRLRDYRLSLRRTEAARVQVTLLSNGVTG